jgi:hypothetical protein
MPMPVSIKSYIRRPAVDFGPNFYCEYGLDSSGPFEEHWCFTAEAVKMPEIYWAANGKTPEEAWKKWLEIGNEILESENLGQAGA